MHHGMLKALRAKTLPAQKCSPVCVVLRECVCGCVCVCEYEYVRVCCVCAQTIGYICI